MDNSDPKDVLTDCALPFPDLKIILNSIELEVSPKDYVIDVSPAQDRSECELAIRKHDAPFNVVGTPLLEDYYVTHSWIDGKMVVQPHS